MRAVILSVSVATIALLLTAAPGQADFQYCQRYMAEMRDLVATLKRFENGRQLREFGFGGRNTQPQKWMDRAKRLRATFRVGKFLPWAKGDEPPTPGDVIGWGLDKMSCASGRPCDREYIAWVEGMVRQTRCVREQ